MIKISGTGEAVYYQQCLRFFALQRPLVVVVIITSVKEGVKWGSVKSYDVSIERKTDWRVVLNKNRTYYGVRTSNSTDTTCSFGMKLCWVKPVVFMCLAPSHFLLVLLACPQILALIVKCHQNQGQTNVRLKLLNRWYCFKRLLRLLGRSCQQIVKMSFWCMYVDVLLLQECLDVQKDDCEKPQCEKRKRRGRKEEGRRARSHDTRWRERWNEEAPLCETCRPLCCVSPRVWIQQWKLSCVITSHNPSQRGEWRGRATGRQTERLKADAARLRLSLVFLLSVFLSRPFASLSLSPRHNHTFNCDTKPSEYFISFT